MTTDERDKSAPEDQCTFSEQAIACLRAMHDNTFWEPLRNVPWGSRPHRLGRRFIMQKYLTSEDILQAWWIHEQQKRIDKDWHWKEPGLAHLAKLMIDRSGGVWQDEQAEYQKTTPTLMQYMEAAWGDETRQAMAQHRRAEAGRRRADFHVVEVDSVDQEDPPRERN
jgi:hypothetical protein